MRNLEPIFSPESVTVVGVSNMVLNHPEIKELDINPLSVHEEGKGATAADCRIILAVPEHQATQDPVW